MDLVDLAFVRWDARGAMLGRDVEGRDSFSSPPHTTPASTAMMEASCKHLQRISSNTCRGKAPFSNAFAQRPTPAKSFRTIARSDRSSPRCQEHRAPRISFERAPKRLASTAAADVKGQTIRPGDQEVDLSKLEAQAEDLIADNNVPSEEQATAMMKTLEKAAQDLVKAHDLETIVTAQDDESATSAILSLGARVRSNGSQKQQASAHVKDTVEAISLLAYKVITHPNVFITTEALVSYSKLQALLSKPESLPEVFDLFATKPAPIAPKTKSSYEPVTYGKSTPDAASAAVPAAAADLALKAAIHIRNLPLALSVIITSYQRPAFRRAKFLKRATLPLAGASLTPIALWTLASNIAVVQTGVDPELFSQYAFAGLATYIGCVGTIGYVAVTSANDQMKRVTWASGTPLRDRWLREEERAAVDRVVCAWGFKEKRRWGEEEGSDWAELKEWAGRDRMMVDQVSLMEGMQ